MSQVVPYAIRPTNIQELIQLSKMIAQSSFCPPTMKGKEGDVAICLQFGAELGLSPMSSIQNIAVINGKPCIWGDGALAVVISSQQYEWHKEWEEGSIEGGDLTCYCTVKRKGSPEYTKSFSMFDAKKANLWSKAGVWQQYPSRMLQMRARAFAVRDQFADALRGISVREEVEDYDTKERVKVSATVVEPTKVIEQVNSDPYTIEQALKDIKECNNENSLKIVFTKAYKSFPKDSEESNLVIEAKDSKRDELTKPTEPVDVEFVSLETGEVTNG